MNNILSKIDETFEINVNSVFELVKFDSTILEFSINKVEKLNNLLKSSGIENKRYLADNTLKQLKLVKEHKSLKPKYETIYNQCVVLLVSYFGSGIKSLFMVALTKHIMIGNRIQNKISDVKIPLVELEKMNYEVKENIGELITNNRNLSFQDMKSIVRSFKEWFNIDLSQDSTMNNISMGQACRHIIVHSGNHVDQKFINQVKNLEPRTIKKEIKIDEKIHFEPEEIFLLGNEMLCLCKIIVEELNSLFK